MRYPKTAHYLFWGMIIFFFSITPLHAQVVLDGTLGSSGAIAGPDYTITADRGRLSGNNLFHSFERFSIRTGESAVFSGPETVANIFARVTGGEASWINGPVASEMTRASFYLINPAGVMFGRGARLDIGGSFTATTAQTLLFEDGGVFSTVSPRDSILSAAPVRAFGFLEDRPAAVSIDHARLEVFQRESISIVSGDIHLLSDAALLAPSGRINLVSVASKGEVESEIDTLNSCNFESMGEIRIAEESDLDTSGPEGGEVYIRAGELVMDKSTVTADSTGVSDGSKGVDIDIRGDMTMTNGSHIDTCPTGDGDGGDISIELDGLLEISDGSYVKLRSSREGNAGRLDIEARSIRVDGQESYAGIFANVGNGASGNAGDVFIRARRDITLLDGAQITVSSWGDGNGGNLDVHADRIVIDDRDSTYRTGFLANVSAEATGNGGDVRITADESIEIINGGEISVSTSGQGDAGRLEIATADLLMDGQGNFAGIFAQVNDGASGDAGDVFIDIDGSLTALCGGQISVSTFGEGNAGTLSIKSERVYLDGLDSSYSTGFLAQVGPAAAGHGGCIEFSVRELVEIVNGAEISASTWGNGPAGDLGISAGQILIDGKGKGAGIFAQVNKGASGHGGTVDINTAETISILNGGQISVSTFSNQDAGSLDISAGGILIDDQDSPYITGLLANVSSGAEGGGADIRVQTYGVLEIVDGGEISVSTFGNGQAGNLDIVARDIRINGQGDGAGIFAQVDQTGDGRGGNVNINAEQSIQLTDGGQISVSTWGLGDAGDLTVAADHIYIDDRNSPYATGLFADVTADAKGDGGDIFILTTQTIEILNGGQISVTTSGHGNAGKLDIRSDGLIRLTDSGEISSRSFSDGAGGNIEISALRLWMDRSAEITSETTAARGGDVFIAAREYIYLCDSRITTSVADGFGSGGNISIDPVFVLLGNSDIIANAYEGRGGNINIDTDYFFPDSLSRIQASSQLGIDGIIRIDTPYIDLSAGFADLPEYRRMGVLSRTSCTSRSDQTVSSLIFRGKGGIPYTPEEL